jgi:hypothetical protein
MKNFFMTRLGRRAVWRHLAPAFVVMMFCGGAGPSYKAARVFAVAPAITTSH